MLQNDAAGQALALAGGVQHQLVKLLRPVGLVEHVDYQVMLSVAHSRLPTQGPKVNTQLQFREQDLPFQTDGAPAVGLHQAPLVHSSQTESTA